MMSEIPSVLQFFLMEEGSLGQSLTRHYLLKRLWCMLLQSPSDQQNWWSVTTSSWPTAVLSAAEAATKPEALSFQAELREGAACSLLWYSDKVIDLFQMVCGKTDVDMWAKPSTRVGFEWEICVSVLSHPSWPSLCLCLWLLACSS
jgi:hypothetical protein